MIGWLTLTTAVLALALAAYAVVATVRRRRIDDPLLLGSAALELAVLAQAVVGFVLLVRTDGRGGVVDGVLFGSYLVSSVLVLPLGVFWALGERSRWGTGVLALTCATTAVLVARLSQIWDTGG